MRHLSILGATGSIGTTTLNLVRRNRERYRIVSLTANGNVEKLANLAREFGAAFAAIGDPARGEELKAALSGTGIENAAGPQALIEAAERDAEWTMAAIIGIAGLAPTVAAIRRGKTVALANKESLVAGGQLVIAEVARCGTTLLPVDSEHNAVFQIVGHDASGVKKVTLTASGGPFRNASSTELAAVTPAQAVRHPNWSMGAKISVDSATLMNKGLELIEAQHLFALSPQQLDVVVHPQSVVHCLVHYPDGAVLAQMSPPDMTTPIAHALAWPDRLSLDLPPLDLAALGRLEFSAPDLARFPCLRLALDAMREGGAAPLVMNTANEVAVERFLRGEIGFMDIPRSVEMAIERSSGPAPASLEEVLALDHSVRQFTFPLAA